MKVLLVVNKQWWERKCPPFWPEQYHALAARKDVTIQVTGPRWQGWSQQRSLRWNIENLYPEADVVYLWRPFGIVEFEGIIGADKPLRQLKVSAYQDDPKFSLQEAKRAGLDLLFYHDHWDRQFYEKSRIRSVYLPLAVNLALYEGADKPIADRKMPVILTGNVNQQTYPLRVRFQRILKRGRVPGHQRQMPGYRMASLNHVMREQQRYAGVLINSKISLVSTCPHIPLTLRKYFESMAAGCVVVGDIPHSPPDDVRECINAVSLKNSESEIADRISSLLKNPEECERQSARNRKVAARYGYAEFADRWVKTVQESLDMQGS